MNVQIKTPESHPDHSIVGRYWGGHSFKHDKTAVYYCDSYDPSIGFWMTNIADSSDRKNISEMAINRTFWEADDDGDYFLIRKWGRKVSKSGALLPKYGEPGWMPRDSAH